MMGSVTLLLGIHNHQPQGNFEHVFAQGFEDCYDRLLKAIAKHPRIRITLHYSGPLIEWIEANHPEHLDKLCQLVESGQVELMGGGFYEPMLSVLPERDARGQLEMMASYWEARTGQRPGGMWLAERVWEPDLARVIANAGYRYTVVDDGHFLAAGMQRPLRGFYLTDKAGRPLALFPISMELRYMIPFKPVEEAIELLLRVADEAGEGGDLVVTYGDDGEKFGMWPGTKQWVWEEGWLERFLELLEQHADRIRTSTFSDALASNRPSGRVYIPTASYDEMGEWSLPAESQLRFHQLTDAVKEQGHKDDWGPFVRGGIWQGFLAKYPESNFMHKRMCYVSDRVARAAEVASRGDDPALQRQVSAATRELYRGQCNCAYWHGLFGGLYLAKLRSAVHTNLIQAHVEATRVLGADRRVELERLDLDGDLSEEVLLTCGSVGVIVNPGRGGTLMAIDDRRRAFCVTDVLTRRLEAYHSKVVELSERQHQPDAEGKEGPLSIHEITALKDEGLAEILVYDPHQRVGLVDQFFAADIDAPALWRCQAEELGDFKEAPYELLQAAGGTGSLTMERTGRVLSSNGPVEVSLQKTINLIDEGSIDVNYRLSTAQPLDGICFATELSLALPSGPDPEVKISVSTSSGTSDESVTARGSDAEVYRVEISDPKRQMHVALTATPAPRVVRFPLETVSQSESGIERTYQGSALVFIWNWNPDSTELEPRLKLKLT